MNFSSTNLIFILLAFSLGVILIWKRDTLPDKLQRPLAITALCMIVFAFFLIVYSFFALGT
ncbi:hypothetical protein [Paenibacillus alvei]|uniref:Signal transduction histidine kinase n=1 Tax=Paenibacillus alvei TaxID=44250 RepID=A0AAP7DKC6_PAEAL|nr:hypothetical protein [Paenibacillus alvei]MBG9736400.1 signal transduction histidine kinase [Paenibacillus alvei]MBG9742880.1 signal transduction histidine kinase [Paenibacillus alvei]MCY9577845.1 hypothetical protein [Paenibacillus alvei]MCY9586969.1 hypothetical protein [Paenibacillus alvei]NEZ42749.1 hypothetical protein [Paenibacillus alvei]